MATTKRIWNKQELTIAYYIAKWDIGGLKITEQELVDYVIGRTTRPSLKMQVANFRFLLQLDGPQLEDASQAMRSLAEELSNHTVVQVRSIIFNYIDKMEDVILEQKTKGINATINKRRDELNAQLESNFLAQVAQKSIGRRLRKIEK